MRKISPCLWFKDQAEEAINFYVSVFPGSRVTAILRYGEAGPGEKGTVMAVTATLAGQEFTALTGNVQAPFSLATSLVVPCDTQEEIDRYWDALTEGGTPIQCGWLTDKYGVAWQIVPAIWPHLMDPSDPARADRVTRAMMPMIKLDLATLQRAYDGE